MFHRSSKSAFAGLLVLAFLSSAVNGAPATPTKLKAVLISAAQASSERLRNLKRDGYNAAALNLVDGSGQPEEEAARRIEKSGLDLYYWIEIARNPTLADAHPEWMASLQGHPEWRRFFPKLPATKTNEVVKNYPWVPMLYQETFPVHLERVKQLLADQPTPTGIFLNDLQGAPSACGCGHPLCRWTTDYGPIKTATRLPNDAAARFVASVKKLLPKAKIVPVWTPECEEHDLDGLCAGVGCFKGTCWREFTTQLMPLARAAESIGALLPYREFQRDLPLYGPTAGWIKHALNSFSEMPPKRNGTAVPENHLIAVLQGWDVTPEQISAQVARSQEAGAAGYVVSLMKIDQSWEPRIVNANAAAQ
ncbi:MAG: hypothetical protein HY298_22075 [Verrucomicrobia bacterium]|nr:hypothetical protein [Verrucomicrobiota bacterium]